MNRSHAKAAAGRRAGGWAAAAATAVQVDGRERRAMGNVRAFLHKHVHSPADSAAQVKSRQRAMGNVRALLHKSVHSPTHSPHLFGATNTRQAGECAFALCGGLIGRILIQLPHKLARANVRASVGIFHMKYNIMIIEFTNIRPNIRPGQ